ncbi:MULTISPECIES: VOC family protein [unclassified Chelatococcus]|uniref:VOC family protein n=1 Tax=unclassified Chelatococcus TaxID=2638111 RepID=UPI0020BEB5EA|nr:MULTISPECIES: VOC family protein [unclassified Chelatococcus]MCO5076176.1 hypothetical protein [Chelatococcus sp.]CAH1669769.1 hypothetical protein CHELA20_50541 [Hyphomicrobiales bacterium]CAH1678785.1 hypothetical protein CHELA41_24586 [Hyphomicrobiales bacterium]
MNIVRLDHIVLMVDSIDTSIAFYVDVPGMRAVTFGDDRKALAFGDRKSTCTNMVESLRRKRSVPRRDPQIYRFCRTCGLTTSDRVRGHDRRWVS